MKLTVMDETSKIIITDNILEPIPETDLNLLL